MVRIHGGLPQFLVAHLAQTLVALDAFALGQLASVGLAFGEHAVAFGVGVHEVVRALGPLEAVQRRHGHVHVAGGDHRTHVAEEQRQVQGCDMRAVHICIGHDDDLVVAHLVEVEVLAVAAADGGDQRFDGVRLNHAVQACALGVEDLASQRQDGLRDRVASLDGGAACGITLHDEQLAFFGVVGLAVLELVRHAGRFEDRLAAGVLTCLLGGQTRTGGLDGLLDDVLGLGRVARRSWLRSCRAWSWSGLRTAGW